MPSPHPEHRSPNKSRSDASSGQDLAAGGQSTASTTSVASSCRRSLAHVITARWIDMAVAAAVGALAA
jgi:hypothetical protein